MAIWSSRATPYCPPELMSKTTWKCAFAAGVNRQHRGVGFVHRQSATNLSFSGSRSTGSSEPAQVATRYIAARVACAVSAVWAAPSSVGLKG